MKYIRQFGIILLISFVGELLHSVLPLPFPASIYGIVILFVCLLLKVIRVEDIEQTSGFLIEIMPIMFIPAAVGLVKSWELFGETLVPLLVITAVSTAAVMAVSGRMTQAVIRHNRKAGKNE